VQGAPCRRGHDAPPLQRPAARAETRWAKTWADRSRGRYRRGRKSGRERALGGGAGRWKERPVIPQALGSTISTTHEAASDGCPRNGFRSLSFHVSFSFPVCFLAHARALSLSSLPSSLALGRGPAAWPAEPPWKARVSGQQRALRWRHWSCSGVSIVAAQLSPFLSPTHTREAPRPAAAWARAGREQVTHPAPSARPLQPPPSPPRRARHLPRAPRPSLRLALRHIRLLPLLRHSAEPPLTARVAQGPRRPLAARRR